ncbi:hypothetical protein CWT12_00460 [Actinomyces sp. 432]|uniref:hypothetical protein n=1 Tax=Actinomyces sp. 432 TaxID=2057798 RepID=UPI001373FAF4|nr:hypothetical protein [Actinomyces sp. 432]QHO90115.1 hypothetical protein CWT12_00460 [Actinomyces sp. 432]
MSEQVRRLNAGDLASSEMHVLMRAAAGLPGTEIRRILAETADDAVERLWSGRPNDCLPLAAAWRGCERPDGGEDDVMSETARRPSPEPSSDDVPQWINDLVPIAARARALLRAGAPALLVAVALVLAIPQLVAHPLPWVAAACVALGGYLALRHGGLAVPTAGVSAIGGNAAGPRAVSGAPAAVGAGPQSSAGGSAATASGELRPGGRTGALLAVLDLVLSAVGLALWAGLALAGTDRALLLAAIAAAGGLVAGVGLVTVMELVGRRRTGVVAALAAVTLSVAVAVACGLTPAAPSWWLVLGLAVGADAVGAIALRVAVRNDRRSAQLVDAA